MDNTQELKNIIDSAQKIAIFCHENPDGDALWSMLWLGSLLEKLGKNVSYFSPDKASKIFSFLKWFDKIKSSFDYWFYNLLIFVDFSEYSRINKIYSNKEKYFKENNILVFDHHKITDHPQNWQMISDTSATSTCEIILENTIDIREKYYDSDIATYLYLWLTTDSGNFRYDNNHERIFKNALDLIKLWADKKLITDNLINNKSMETIRFLKVFLERLEENWDILYSYYDSDELDNFNVDNEQASYGLTLIQEIKWPRVIMTIRKEWNVVKWSLRSKNTNVEKIAQQFGGGWHMYAAGFSIEIKNSFEETKNTIIQKINSLLD